MLLQCYGYLIFYMKWVYYLILFLNLSALLKNNFHRHHQELRPGEKIWTKHYSNFLNFSFNCLCPNLETSWHVPQWLQPAGLREVSQGALTARTRQLPALQEQNSRAEPAPSPSWGSGVGGDLPASRKKISARRDGRETGPVLESPSKF